MTVLVSDGVCANTRECPDCSPGKLNLKDAHGNKVQCDCCGSEFEIDSLTYLKRA